MPHIKLKDMTCIDGLLHVEGYLDKKKDIILQKHLVDSTGCWIWQGYAHCRTGRAMLSVGNRPVCAARIAYLAFKRQPLNGLHVCHSCDNVTCVNPDHLWLGTPTDNCRDRTRKGRTVSPRGEKNGRSKLREEDVAAIRELIAAGTPQMKIANKFGVAQSLIHAIAHRQIWKD